MRALLIGVLLFLPLGVQAQALPFDRERSIDGACLYRPTRDFRYAVDALGNPETPGNTEFTAIDNAFTRWSAAVSACSGFTFTNVGPIANLRAERLVESPNVSALIFRQRRCSVVVPTSDPCFGSGTCGNQYNCWEYSDSAVVVPTTTYSVSTGEIFDTDVEFNTPSFIFTTVDSPVCQAPNFAVTCVASDVQNLTTNMIGRMLGIATNSDSRSTMARTSPPGELSKRVIDQGTINGFCAAYSVGLPPRDCDGGFVVVPDAGMDAGMDAGLDAGPGTGGGSGGGSGNPGCGPATCAGCCGFDGRCQPGNATATCGSGGLLCAACSGQSTCESGQCVAPRGCGCGTEGGSMLLMLVLVVGRRRFLVG